MAGGGGGGGGGGYNNNTVKLTLMIDGWGISCEIACRWMSLDLTDVKSVTSVQVMA